MINDTALFMFGIQGKTPNDNEIKWLQHPLTAGVILFTRNYENPRQIQALVKTLREIAQQDILIAVDHEGGRVQRFREGFTVIPAMAKLGLAYDDCAEHGLQLAKSTGYVLAHELAECDIDFSFAPVLDVQTDFSQVIRDRGFHRDVNKIGTLAGAFYQGMQNAGMIGVGKHFPGHGNVVADSHLELPICEADFETLRQRDLPPFEALIKQGIEAIMPAHVVYRGVDELPAGFSSVWLQKILREQLQFNGCIISDDLDMAGAAAFGNMAERVALAEKHCDLILLCNNHEHMKEAFESQIPTAKPQRQKRIERLKRNANLHNRKSYQEALAELQDWQQNCRYF